MQVRILPAPTKKLGEKKMENYIVIRLYVHKHEPTETFVDIEDSAGKSISIGNSFFEGPYRLITITEDDLKEALK